MEANEYIIEMQVRDYELDQFGVVNNSVYLKYLEHARHEFMFTLGVDPAQVARDGRSLALAGINVRFRAPLRSRDRFRVRVTFSGLSGVRATLHQRIERLPGHSPVLEAWAEAVFLDDRGRPQRMEPDILERFRAYLEPSG